MVIGLIFGIKLENAKRKPNLTLYAQTERKDRKVFAKVLVESLTAEGSYPQWTIQSAHFGFLDFRPYLSHAVSAISEAKLSVYPSPNR